MDFARICVQRIPLPDHRVIGADALPGFVVQGPAVGGQLSLALFAANAARCVRQRWRAVRVARSVEVARSADWIIRPAREYPGRTAHRDLPGSIAVGPAGQSAVSGIIVGPALNGRVRGLARVSREPTRRSDAREPAVAIHWQYRNPSNW